MESKFANDLCDRFVCSEAFKMQLEKILTINWCVCTLVHLVRNDICPDKLDKVVKKNPNYFGSASVSKKDFATPTPPRNSFVIKLTVLLCYFSFEKKACSNKIRLFRARPRTKGLKIK